MPIVFIVSFAIDASLNSYLKKYINVLRIMIIRGGYGVPASIEVCGNAKQVLFGQNLALWTTLGPGSIPGSRPIFNIFGGFVGNNYEN